MAVLSRVIRAQLRDVVQAGLWMVLAGVLAALGAGFLILAGYSALSETFGPVMAAAGLGVGFLAIAALAAGIARSRSGTRQGPPASEVVTVGALLDAFVEGQKAGRDKQPRDACGDNAHERPFALHPTPRV